MISGLIFPFPGIVSAQSNFLMRETFGTQLGSTISSYSIPVYETAGGFDNSSSPNNYRYQGTGTVQRSYTSDSYYADASGASNIFLNYGNTLILSNIGPKTVQTGLHVYFGLFKSKVNVMSYPNALPRLEYATDYNASTQTGTFTAVSLTNINNSNGWQLVDAYISIPVSATVALRITNTSNTNGDDSRIQYRIDDLQIDYNPCTDMPNPSIAFSSGSATSCQGSTIALTDPTSYGFAVQYAWVNDANPSTVLSSSATLSSLTPAVGTSSYTLTVKKANNSCPKQASQSIVVKPLPNAAISGSSTVCQSAGSPSIMFTGSNATAPYTFTYKINGGANQTITSTGSTATVSASTSSSGSFVYSLVSVQDAAPNSCSKTVSGSATVTVAANHTLSLSSTAGTDAQTICSANAISPIAYTFGGGASGTSVSGLPSGLSTSTSGNSLTIAGTPSVTGTFNYTVTTSGNACTVASATGTIIIQSAHTVTRTSAAGTTAQSPCLNTAITTISYSVGGGGTGASVTGLPAGVIGSYSSGTFTISGSPSATGSFNYTVTTSGNSCTAASATGTITVLPLHTISLSSTAGTNAQTRCVNAAIMNITYTVGGGATSANVSGLPAGLSASISGTTFTISGSPTVSGTFNYTVTTNGNACTAATATGSIVVNPSPTVNLGSNDADNAICTGSIVIFTATSGLTSYSFRVNGATVQTGAANTYTTSVLSNGQAVDVIGTNSNSCSTTSSAITTTVHPNLVITGPTPASLSECIGGTATVSISTTGAPAPGYSFEWRKSTTPTGTYSASGLTGNNSSSYIPAATATGVSYYKVNVTGGCQTVPATGTLSSNYSQVTVVAKPVVAIAFSQNTAYTAGALIATRTYTGTATITGGIANTPAGTEAYQWQINGGGGSYSNVINNSTYAGATTNTLSITVVQNEASSTRTFQCIATQSASGCSNTSNAATFTVVHLFGKAYEDPFAEESMISIYPNPFSDHLTIRTVTLEDAKASIIITDMMGRIMGELDYDLLAGMNEIYWNGTDRNGNNLPSGSYIISVNTPLKSGKYTVIKKD